jgi:hypothetical protein
LRYAVFARGRDHGESARRFVQILHLGKLQASEGVTATYGQDVTDNLSITSHPEIASFNEETAKATGRTLRAMARDTHRGEKLGQEVLAKIAHTARHTPVSGWGPTPRQAGPNSIKRALSADAERSFLRMQTC